MTAPKGRRHRLCIFCQSTNVSKEHFYSGWMAELLDASQGHEVHHITSHRLHGVLDRKRSSRPAPMQTKKVRAPCKACNNGWMNRTEESARPFLTSMIRGESISLNLVAQLAVAKWIALKVMVAEHSDQELAVTPIEDRQTFMKTGQIPSYFRIYVGMHSLESDMGYIRHSATASRTLEGPVPPLGGLRRNVQQVTFLAGRLFAHVNAARVDGFELEERLKVPLVHESMRLWPMQRFVFNWPEGILLDAVRLDELSHSWERLASGPNAMFGGEIDAHGRIIRGA